ncbi:hypothetical protein, partial [Enterobacter hormaechei]|uniref:hypothetical protein n=1 Tax=Enterobacter hormaechei TaxID=158836 RepID=UPI0023E13135
RQQDRQCILRTTYLSKISSSSIAAYTSLLPFAFNNPNNPKIIDTRLARGYYNPIKTTQRAGGWIAGMQ